MARSASAAARARKACRSMIRRPSVRARGGDLLGTPRSKRRHVPRRCRRPSRPRTGRRRRHAVQPVPGCGWELKSSPSRTDGAWACGVRQPTRNATLRTAHVTVCLPIGPAPGAPCTADAAWAGVSADCFGIGCRALTRDLKCVRTSCFQDNKLSYLHTL